MSFNKYFIDLIWASFSSCVFMDLNLSLFTKKAKRELGQYPAILTLRLVIIYIYNIYVLYGKLRKPARWTKFYAVIGYWSRQADFVATVTFCWSPSGCYLDLALGQWYICPYAYINYFYMVLFFVFYLLVVGILFLTHSFLFLWRSMVWKFGEMEDRNSKRGGILWI